MRTIPTLIVDDELVLRPVGPMHLEALVEAFEESTPEVIHGLPWYDIEEEMLVQLQDYLIDVNNMGKTARAYHWAIIDSRDETFLGLLALDRFTRTQRAHWNIGYWVRRSACRRGIAKRTSMKALDWVSTTQGGPTAVEITVDPNNEAGLATCNSLVNAYNGVRAIEGDGEVEVAGKSRHHITFLLPRLPLINSEISNEGRVWLSLDTDDLCHHPKQFGHPTRTKNGISNTPYRMSKTLESGWDGFVKWRNGAGRGLPVTLFVIAEQLDDERFATRLRELLQSDNLITIGTHGNRHRCWSAWPEDTAGFHNDLSISISRLFTFAGTKFRPWFRAPGGYIAPWMVDVLSREGIILDSSVNYSFITRKKAGKQKDWAAVQSMLFHKGIVERQWYIWAGIPVTGPALRIPIISLIAARKWRKVTRNKSCASEQVIVDQNYPIDSLYWHLLDHARNGGNWAPPLHKSLS
ncbi:MAG: GNAT family N-acetyltransferase [Candidatus Thalassarchaeaceae archaeon]|nr:GNAT family N-acetyltransferase [Candidatus Thalassarchaeaceae archaeon]